MIILTENDYIFKYMKKLVLIAAALLTSLAAFAQTALPNDPAVRVGKLDNGMTYYIRHNDKPAQRAEFYLATNVGAIQETPDQDGLAHFLEHMCFNGTKNFPDKALLEYLQKIGAEFGRNINAATGVEQTTYMLNNMPVTRDGIIDTCLLVMHDYSHFVTCDPVEIDKERGVIIEERRSRRTAQWRMYEKAKHYYYGDSKYANCTLIGSQDNLETFKPESLTNFYHTWYRPDLQALIVVGDVDVDSIEAKIKTIFADIPAVDNPQPKEAYPVPDHEEPLIGILTDPELSSSSIEIYWKYEAADIEYNATEIGLLTSLIRSIIGKVMNERFADITSKPGTPFINADLGIGDLCRTCEAVYGDVVFKDGTAKEAFTAFMNEVEKAKRYGFTDAEVERAKNNILSSLEKAVQGADSRTNADLVRPLINNFFIKTPYMVPKQRYELTKEILANIPAEALSKLFANMIDGNMNLSIVYMAPEKEGLVHPTAEELKAIVDEAGNAEIQANEDKEVASSFVDASKLKGSKVKKESKGIYGSTEWTLKNGLKVVVLPTDYRKDQVMFSLWKRGGKTAVSDEELYSIEDNVWQVYLNNSGISSFTASDLPKMLSGKNLSVNPFIQDTYNGVSGNCAPKDIETALQIAYLYFADPRFDEAEYQVGIDQINALLPNLVNQPNFKLQTEIHKSLYGDSPRTVSLSEDSVKKADLKTLETVYRRLFADANGATMVIVGNVDLQTLKPLCEKYLGSIAKGKKPLNGEYDTAKIVKGKVTDHFAVNMQTPKNTVLQVYTADMPYDVDTKICLSAAQNILDMIYVDTLREEEGGTYGASCAMVLDPDDNLALIQVYFETNPTQSESLRKLAIDGLHKLAYDGPTEEQMTRVRENMSKNVPEDRIQNRYWLSNILMSQRYGVDYDTEYQTAVENLSAEKIQKVLQEILEQENFIEIEMSPATAAERE